MNRSRWLPALLALHTVFWPAALAAAEAPVASAVAGSAAVSAERGLAGATRCLSLDERREYEEGDCARAVYADLAAGHIDRAEALSRLERCAAANPELAAGLQWHAQRQAALSRARATFYISTGDAPPPRDSRTAEAVRALRDAGVTPYGFEPRSDSSELASLGSSASLRDAFRTVFGDTLAGDLGRLLRGADGAHALVLGEHVIVPGATRGPSARVVDHAAYEARVARALTLLESARQRYLRSAGAAHRHTGSVQSFVRSVGTLGGGDEQARAAIRRAAEERAEVQRRLDSLQGELGLDPALFEMARRGVAFATELDVACGEAALGQRRWIQAGAGGLAALALAAGAVVAAGSAGTLAGGITIAAALEASLAAYLIARSERGQMALLAQAEEAEAEREAEAARAEVASRGTSPDAEWEEEGETGWEERRRSGGEGVALGEAGDGEWRGAYDDAPARPAPAPPRIPAFLPDGELVLPRMLDAEQTPELRTATFADIQLRLDEFLEERRPAPEPARQPEQAAGDAAFVEGLMREAEAALALWQDRRLLSPGFGDFFLRAQLEEVGPAARAGSLARARTRFAADQGEYRSTPGLAELRQRMGERLMAHCRAGPVAGDLVLAACADQTALTVLLLAAVQEARIAPPDGSVLGVQFIGERVHPVLFYEAEREVESLIRGDRVRGVGGAIYHPAALYYTFLLEHGASPEIDLGEHLLIAAPDRALDEPEPVCAAVERGFLGRVVDWLKSVVGIRTGSGVGESCRQPTESVAAAEVGTVQEAEDAAGRAGETAEASEEGREAGTAREETGRAGPRGEPRGGEGTGGAGEEEEAAASAGGAEGAEEAAADEGDERAVARAAAAEITGTAAGDARGEATPNRAESEDEGGASELDLAEIARLAMEMTQRAEDAGPLKIAPWVVAADSGFNVPSARVLYADNELARSWFREGDRFITLSPSDTEEQRRMAEADAHPQMAASTTCQSAGLPPRRVFRRAGADGGFRYAFCDQDESLVIFAAQQDARGYAGLSAPDRPVFLARLATDRLAQLDGSEEMRLLRRFLQDPEVLRTTTRKEVESLDETVSALLTFQHTLESALVQSMEELDEPALRGRYYDLHRQVIQAPFFLDLAESVHRLNWRLASDPLQSLAWANALEGPVRQDFFRLYHLLGLTMQWSERWEQLEAAYAGDEAVARPRPAAGGASLDFLSILSDPLRVQVDWRPESSVAQASVRDDRSQRGERRSPDPADPERPERQGAGEESRLGTLGLGRVGSGDGIGPERGKRPLQMISIRVVPDSSGPAVPTGNRTRPGGVEGRAQPQGVEPTEREPTLRVKPETFVDALLSTWDTGELLPASAGRVPPVLRFSRPLRQLFVQELARGETYDRRLLLAMQAFTAGGWLRYEEVQRAMDGEMVAVRARETGTAQFNAEFSRNAPINDLAQIRVPDFFGNAVIMPADLYEALRASFLRSHTGYFDLAADPSSGGSLRLEWVPREAGTPAAERAALLRDLQTIARQGPPRSPR